MIQETELEAARFFMKLERMLNELEDEKEIATHNLHISHLRNISRISKNSEFEKNQVKVLDARDMNCSKRENILP